MIVGKANRLLIATGQRFGVLRFACALRVASIDGADGVDDIFGRQTAGGGEDSFAGGEASDFRDEAFAVGEDGWAAGAVYGAIDAASAEKRGVGGVDDGLGGFFGDIGGAGSSRVLPLAKTRRAEKSGMVSCVLRLSPSAAKAASLRCW